MQKRHSVLLYILDGVAVLILIATFTPFVIPQSETGPYLFGVPYTMWAGFTVSVLFIVLAFLVSIIYKREEHAD